MTNEELLQLKQYYTETTISPEKVDALWEDAVTRLPSRRHHPYHYQARYAFMTLVVLITLGSVAQLVRGATPDSALYPVRVLAGKITAKATGRYDLVVENRTDDIIKAVKKNSPSDIKKAASAYNASLNDAKSASPSSEESKERLRESLQKSKEKLRTVTPANSSTGDIIRESINATNNTEKAVKGTQTESKGPQKQEEKEHNAASNGNGNSSQNQSESRNNNK